MLIMFSATMLSYVIAYHSQAPVMSHFGFKDRFNAHGPPWDSITHEFAEGIGAMGAYGFNLVVALPIWRRWPAYAGIMIWMPLMSFGSKAVITGDVTQID